VIAELLVLFLMAVIFDLWPWPTNCEVNQMPDI